MEYALRVLAMRAHTSTELRQKLRTHAERKRSVLTNELEEQVLNRLIELKLIDDEAFVRRQIETAQTFRHEGLFKVAHKLQNKGIPLEDTKKLWSATGISELDIAAASLGKIASKISKIPKEKRFEKQARYLAGRGFSPETIYKVLRRSELP